MPSMVMHTHKIERVEVLDEDHQRFRGQIYRRRQNGYFYNCWGRALHRNVYKWHYGLSKRLVVHHKDGDPSNNQIENLDAMLPAFHNQIHHSKKKD